MPKKINDEELLLKADEFKKYFLSGIPAKESGKLVGIGEHKALHLCKLLGLKRLQNWQKLGIPASLKEETIGIIIGTVMGDASIHNCGWSPNKLFRVSHSPKQKEYLIYKYNLLKELKPYEIKESNDKWGTLNFTTVPHPHLTCLYDAFYTDGIKQISNNILEMLTPHGIALWFMDDGCLLKGGFSIATCAFNNKSIKNIENYFKIKYDIEFIIRNYDYPRMNLYGKNAVKFKKLIEAYIIPKMSYKLKISDKTGTVVKWTDENDVFLTEKYYSKMPVSEIATLLHKTKGAITNSN